MEGSCCGGCRGSEGDIDCFQFSAPLLLEVMVLSPFIQSIYLKWEQKDHPCSLHKTKTRGGLFVVCGLSYQQNSVSEKRVKSGLNISIKRVKVKL